MLPISPALPSSGSADRRVAPGWRPPRQGGRSSGRTAQPQCSEGKPLDGRLGRSRGPESGVMVEIGRPESATPTSSRWPAPIPKACPHRARSRGRESSSRLAGGEEREAGRSFRSHAPECPPCLSRKTSLCTAIRATPGPRVDAGRDERLLQRGRPILRLHGLALRRAQSSRWTRSLRSWRSWASSDSVAIGRASRRFSEIGSPVSSQ
jgi:hypothetical protein